MLSILEEPEIRQQAYPVSVELYHELGRLGLIDEKTELLEGVIVTKMSKSPLHQVIIRRLQLLLQSVIRPGCFVDRESPITCIESEPEPDLAVIEGDATAAAKDHPTTAELVIEVSINTVRRDKRKARIYANAGVKEYWLVEPEARRITLHRQPGAEGYAVTEIHEQGEALSEAVPGFQVVLSDLFGA